MKLFNRGNNAALSYHISTRYKILGTHPPLSNFSRSAPAFVFHFYKKLKNEIQFIFRFSFSRGNWKKNYLKRSRLTFLWLCSQVLLKRYSRATSCQVPWDSSLCNGHVSTKNQLFRNQLIYFNVYFSGCYFHICFALVVNCDIKHISRRSHREVFS